MFDQISSPPGGYKANPWMVEGQGDMAGSYNWNPGLSPDVLSSLSSDWASTLPGFSGQAVHSSNQGDMSFGPSLTPEVMAYLRDNGYQIATRDLGGQSRETVLFDPSGKPVGTPMRWNEPTAAGDALGLGAVLAAPFVVGGLSGVAGGGSVGGSVGGSGLVAGTGGTGLAAGTGGVGLAGSGGIGAGIGSTIPASTGIAGLGAAGAAGAAGGAGSGGLLGSVSSALGVSPGTLVSGAGSLFNAGLGAYASNKAADAQQASAREANALAKYMYDTTRDDYAPWRETGTWALGQAKNLLSDPSQITNDPGYQFGLKQGITAFDNSGAARGMRLSGAQAKALTRYGQDYAGTKMDQTLNRYNSLSGSGLTATGGTAQAGQNYSTQAGQNITGAGNAQAAGYIGGANAIAGGVNNFLRNWQENEMLRRIGVGG